jgi:hypothetical protein
MRVPELSCGKFLGYRILCRGGLQIYLSSVEGVVTADLNDLLDFAKNIAPKMTSIYVYESYEDLYALRYSRKLGEWSGT